MKEFLGVPIRHRGETLGEIYLSGTPAGRFSAQEQRVVEMLASHAGVAIATANLYSRGQALAVMEERQRVARELHDAVSQTLFSMVYAARAAALSTTDDPKAASAALRSLGDQAAAALSEMRGLVYALRPKSLERDGLAATITDLADRLRRAHQADIELRVQGKPVLAFDQELALLRIAQEAMQNSLKHARGAAIAVVLRHRKAGTELVVSDSGPGFDAEELPRTLRTMGLTTMRERAADIHASLSIHSDRAGGGGKGGGGAGGGTEVRVFLPATAEPPGG
jgi:signal transduction histidine kinase